MNNLVEPVAAPRTSGQSTAVVSALVEAGLLEAARHDDAVELVRRVLGEPTPAASEQPAPLRRRLAEVAGYVGGAFVVAAAGLFFGNEWNDLSRLTRLGLLGGIAILLAAGAMVLVLTAGGLRAMWSDGQPVRRRLAGMLFTGAAASAAFAVSLQVADAVGGQNSQPVLVGGLTFAIVAALGYFAAPTVLGQLAIATGVFLVVPSALDISGDVNEVPFGLLVLALGVAWVVLSEYGVWREADAALVIGPVLVFVGAQIPIVGTEAVAYMATALVAVAAFAVYVVRHSWPYLATGVVAVTVAVPEALVDLTDGSLGSAGVLLVTGLTLIGAALLGLRLRKEVSEQPAG